MDLTNFADPAPGKLTPYTAVFVFAVGVFASNFIFNTIAMKRPVEGEPISIGGYFRGSAKTHLVGILGGVIWCVGQSFSMIASEQAGAAISYGLGQGATLVSAMWGILVWKEFKGAPESVRPTECLDVRSVYRRTQVPDLRGGLRRKAGIETLA